MIRNDEVKTALIAKLLSNTTITSELVDYVGESLPDEIRENQWGGTEFAYPNIRVRMISLQPLGDKDCQHAQIAVSFIVFSESDNSLQADKIAGIINNELNGKQFNVSNIAFSLRLTNLIPALHITEKTWRAECLMSGVASKLI
jgi:hypothetical protein